MPPILWINYTNLEEQKDGPLRRQTYSNIGKFYRNRSKPSRAGRNSSSGAANETAKHRKPRLKWTDSPPCRGVPGNIAIGRLQSPTRCIGSLGPLCTPLDNFDASVLRYYLNETLSIVWRNEFEGKLDGSVLSHRFFPILENTFQLAMLDQQLLDSLLAVTAYLMANLTAVKDKATQLGHQASQRAIRSLRGTLDTAVDTISPTTLHTILHLANAAFTCGELDIAIFHSRGFMHFVPSLRNRTSWEECIHGTAFMHDTYVATETGRRPMMVWDVEEDKDRFPEPSCTENLLKRDHSTDAPRVPNAWGTKGALGPGDVSTSCWVSRTNLSSERVTRMPHRTLSGESGSGFGQAIATGILSSSLHSVIRLFLSLADFRHQWSTAEFITVEALEWCSLQTLRIMHELCQKYGALNTLQKPASHASNGVDRLPQFSDDLEELSVDQEVILALQLVLITTQGSWLNRTRNVLIGRLRRCMAARLRTSSQAATAFPSSKESAASSQSSNTTLHSQVQLWTCIIGILGADSAPEERSWFQSQAVRLAKSLNITDRASMSAALSLFGVRNPNDRDSVQTAGRVFVDENLP